MDNDSISLLEEEFTKLSIKSSLVQSLDKPTLICLVWTKKSYNPDSFRAQLQNIWKTKKKFDIRVVGRNLFLIAFEEEEDLELILKGRLWMFRKHLILFDKLHEPIERSKIGLHLSPF